MTKNNTRTQNSAYNLITSLGGQLLLIVMQFAVRTVFIYTLGKSYLGISDLFSNILSLLSLTEFGVGNAILFKLYDPIAQKDHRRIAALMHFYRTVYRMIGLTVLLLGLSLIPFLRYVIKDYHKLVDLNLNAAIIFGLYLAKTVASYAFFAYKSAIVKANQKEYILNLIGYIFTIGGGIVQIICLLIYPKFELYIVISVIQVLIQNIIIAIYANRTYPFIKDNTAEKIERKETIEIFKDCGALFLYKLNGVVLKATDNIVLSVFIGLDMVGTYSNYYVFYTTINTFFIRIFGSVAHSLGNLHTTHNNKHEYQVFERINWITAVLGGIAFAGIFCVADEFILQWLGESWLIPQPFSFLMGFELYTLASRLFLGKYRNTMGLFQQAKWRPLVGMFINLVVSIALVNIWGICGVLVGTLVADWTTIMWYDPMIIYKHGFENFKPVSAYYKRLFTYTVTVLGVGVIDYYICRHFFVGYGWWSVMVHGLICATTVPASLLLLVIGKQEGKYFVGVVAKVIKKFGRK